MFANLSNTSRGEKLPMRADFANQAFDEVNEAERSLFFFFLSWPEDASL